MPPRPIDSRNVYQKTLYAQQEADRLHTGAERERQIRQQMFAEERETRLHDQVDIPVERAPARRTERDALREKRRQFKKRDQRDYNARESADEDDGADLRKRVSSDDEGKGEKLDLTG